MTAKKKAAPEPARESPFYYFNCAHGGSNAPCAKGCHNTPYGQPDLEPVPDNWFENYVPPGFVDCPDCVRKPGGQGRVDPETACATCKGVGYMSAGPVDEVRLDVG